MKYIHTLKDVDICLNDAIARHSADKSIVYKQVNGEPLYIGYFFPKDYDRTKKYPTFVMIHGGGWSSHKIFEEQKHWMGDHLGYLARYYADRGFLCVSIDYRLMKDLGQAEGYGLIDCYEDCCDAMDYVLTHAEAYGVDSERLFLLGESAGGHLAGAVATFHHDRRYSFSKAFLVNAITDLFDHGWRKCVPVKSNQTFLTNMILDERVKFLSPLYQVDEKIGEVILIHGEKDSCVSLEHSRKFYEKMLELSKPCELHIIESTNHAFLLAEYSKETQACKIAIEIINSHLV